MTNPESLDPKTIGAWLVHHTNKLGLVTDSNDYGNIRVAGKCGVLLSALSVSKDSSLDNDKVAALAGAAGINHSFELPTVLPKLQELGVVEIHDNGIEILGLTSAAVLQHTTNVFETLRPTPKEKASLILSELCSEAPIERKALSEIVSDLAKLDENAVNALLNEAKEIGFSDFESIDRSSELFFNGNLFRKDELQKVSAVLDSLTPVENERYSEIEEELRQSGCLSADVVKTKLGVKLFQKLQSIGLFDVNVVSNSNEKVAFVTRPSAFSKFGNAAVEDSFDLAKALVSSIKYGMTRSDYSRGRISMVHALLSKLIRGQWVGPASAIGEDYRILELKNVVKVKKTGSRFLMKLLKKEVGELALQVITSGDASEQSLPNFPSAAISSFSHPEAERSKTRKKIRTQNPGQLTDLLQTIRTGR